MPEINVDIAFKILIGVVALILVATTITQASAANGLNNSGVNLGALAILVLSFIGVGFAIKIFKEAYSGT